jgi:uncharacterized protein (TIGR02246 family)
MVIMLDLSSWLLVICEGARLDGAAGVAVVSRFSDQIYLLLLWEETKFLRLFLSGSGWSEAPGQRNHGLTTVASRNTLPVVWRRMQNAGGERSSTPEAKLKEMREWALFRTGPQVDRQPWGEERRPGMGKAQKGHARDEDAIRRLMADYTHASNRHDAKAMSMLWARDGDSVNSTGQVVRGRAEIEKTVAELHSKFFRGARITRTVRAIRFIKPDVAIADGSWKTVGALGPDGKEYPPLKGLYTIITVKQRGVWLILAARSMMPVPPFPERS